MLANAVLEGCNAPGTGPLNLTGPIAGRRGFVQEFGSNVRCFYGVTDGSQTELGWTTTGTTLTRNVIWNTAGNQSPINFTGACQVYSTLPAQRWVYADESGTLIRGQSRRLVQLAAAQDVTDAPILDQLRSIRFARITLGETPGWSTGMVNVIFTLPANYGISRWTVTWDNVTPSAGNAIMLCRVAADTTNFYAGSTDYMQQSLQMLGANAPTNSQGDYSYIGATPALSQGAPSSGRFTMAAKSDHSFEMDSRALTPGAWWSQRSNGRVAPNRDNVMGAILLGIPGGIATGTFSLVGER